MYTKGQIVAEAFAELGLAAYEFDLTADEIQGAIRRMDAMIANWEGRGWHLGYALPDAYDASTPDDASGLADTDALAVIQNLAIAIAPSYGKTPSQETRTGARNAVDNIRARFATPYQQQYQNTMPRGAGNRRSFWRTNFYPVPDTGALATDETGLVVKD